MKKTRILAADDESAIRYIISSCLKETDYEPILATDGKEALHLFDEQNPDLIILDIKMPGMNGFEVCRAIREYSSVPIIILTAMGDDDDVLRGLECGADDYITKPFNTDILLARIQSVMRRSNRWDTYNKPEYSYEGLIIDFKGHTVLMGGKEISVTATEYRMLSYLAMNAGLIVTPDQILEYVWGEEYVGDHNLLQVNIARLRRKLEDNTKDPKYILTRPSMGYMMKKP